MELYNANLKILFGTMIYDEKKISIKFLALHKIVSQCQKFEPFRD